VITARDRKIILVLVPLMIVIGYWFLVLAPKRAQSSKVAEELTQAQGTRDTAEQQVAQLNSAKASFADDYATVIRLGKAVPTTVDMPSLLVQLDRAARGTGIQIADLKPGVATSAENATPGTAAGGSSAPSGTQPGGGANPAAQGAPPAQTMPGKAAQNAGNSVNQSNATNQANANKAGAPAGAAPGATGAPAPAGLQTVPLTFTMDGTFFDLADFFHRMKRFVRVVNDQIVVRGRLLTIESFDFKNSEAAVGGAKTLRAEVSATIYLTPPAQGATAGASPSGPASAAGTPSQPAPSGSPSAPPAPAATATP
jgi:hypothetical protein